jgi:hypothetical protein
MYHQDEKGRRRSARNQGLAPPPLPTNAPLDLLSDEYQADSNDNNNDNNTPTPIPNSGDSETYDLLSFDPVDDEQNDCDDGNSSNFLSSTSSPLYDQFWHRPPSNQQYPAPNTWTPMPHQPTDLNPMIIELQNTIRLLNNRLGMLEATP